jgi:hypothetical protein
MRALHLMLAMFFGLLVGLSATETLAQSQDRGQIRSAPRVAPRSGGSSSPPSSRVVTPPAGRRAVLSFRAGLAHCQGRTLG